jgi:hypothetical protein
MPRVKVLWVGYQIAWRHDLIPALRWLRRRRR